MGESTLEWAKRQKVSAAQTSGTNAVCEDCGRKWTATLTEVPVTIFIKDLDEYYKKLSRSLLEAVEPSMVLCVFRPSDRDVWDTEVTLSVVAPHQDTPYHWRINHKFSGPAAVSGCQISIWRADQSSASKSDDVHIEQDVLLVTIKQEIKEELKEEEDELMVEDIGFDPLAGNRNYDPDDPDPDWTNSDTDTQLVKRFARASSADIAEIRAERHRQEEGTKKANKWAANVFQDWYTERVECGDYDDLNWQTLSKEQFNEILTRFYVEVRRQDGKPYSKQALVGLRAGIQRYLNDEPWFVQYTLMLDPAFKESNETMAGVLKRQGMDTVQHHKPMDPKDIEKLKSTNVIGTDNPLSLQRLIWFGIALHFGRRSREEYRKMTTDTLVINVDADGRRYLQQAYCKKNKNQGGKPSNRMYEQPNDKYCMFKAYELYVSLIHDDMECLWQRPNMRFKETGYWYHKQVVGKHVIGDFLKNMCKDAGISTVYTNQSVGLTTSTLLNEAGFEQNDIMDVTGHKSTHCLKRKIADTLSNAFSEGQANIFPSTSDKTTNPHLLVPTAQTNSPVTHSMFSFDLDSHKELNQTQL